MSNILHMDFRENNTFGSRLKAYRKSKDISVNELVGKILEYQGKIIDQDLVNNFRKTYYNWENDKTTPNIDVLDMICNILDCDYDFLMCKIDVPKKDSYNISETTGLSFTAIETLKIWNKYYILNNLNAPGSLELRALNFLFEKCAIDNELQKNNIFKIIGLYLFSNFESKDEIILSDRYWNTSLKFKSDDILPSILITLQGSLMNFRDDVQKIIKGKKAKNKNMTNEEMLKMAKLLNEMLGGTVIEK